MTDSHNIIGSDQIRTKFVTTVQKADPKEIVFEDDILVSKFMINNVVFTRESMMEARKSFYELSDQVKLGGNNSLELDNQDIEKRAICVGKKFGWPDWLSASVFWLIHGEIVSIPTETVYGLASSALSASAVKKIYEAKGRPSDNPLIVHISSLEMLSSLINNTHDKIIVGSNGDMSGIPKVYHELIDSFWPGPLTIILPRPNNDLIPDNILGNVQVNSTVAFRFPSHPVARAIIACSNLPLAAPSANSSGKPSPTIASHVEADLRGLIPLVIDSGSCTFGLESTVVDAVSNSLPTMSSENVEISQIDEYNLTTNTATNSDTKQLVKIPCVLRPGGITVEQIMQMKNKNILNEPKNLKTQNNNIDLWKQIQVYGKTFANKVIESAPTTPGMKYKHYSPQAQVSLFIPQSPNHSNHTVENNSSIKKEMIKSIIEIIQNTSTTTKFTNKTLEKSSRIDDKEPTFNNSNEYRIGVIVIEDGSFSWNKALCNLQLENNISDNQKPSKYQISLVNYDFNSPKKPSTNILSSNRNDGDGFVNVIVAIVSGIDGLGNSMFGLLRLMDDFNVEKVLVEGVAEIGQGLAIMNRLKKAATIHISH
ncbi:hypothetical protein BB558_001372 [Smittium angustum]|uniref:Threonylcarbamoyl-AMP synthase n=1 Tax=Smittium angustum TaxID=133377 RepID=A0A2U1JC28_SMIAN|nr:hypothetical protein BB558_001372 [Smittium angustum]